jgi:DNA-binding transcriptional MerR regulator
LTFRSTFLIIGVTLLFLCRPGPVENLFVPHEPLKVWDRERQGGDRMAAQGNGGEASGDQDLLTLTEVSNRTGISMPTLQRYKKEFQDRIPSVGKGRKQRYPADSLDVFEQIKQENIKKRGRPRKSGGGGRPAAAAKKEKSPAPARSDLLTLTEVSERTGISYPTLVRYVKLHGDDIPYEGEGRRRRYHPQAVEVFQKLRSQSGRGRRKKGAAAPAAASPAAGGGGGGGGARAAAAGDGSLAKRVRSLEKSQEKLEQQIRDLLRELKKPMTVTLSRGK